MGYVVCCVVSCIISLFLSALLLKRYEQTMQERFLKIYQLMDDLLNRLLH